MKITQRTPQQRSRFADSACVFALQTLEITDTTWSCLKAIQLHAGVIACLGTIKLTEPFLDLHIFAEDDVCSTTRTSPLPGSAWLLHWAHLLSLLKLFLGHRSNKPSDSTLCWEKFCSQPADKDSECKHGFKNFSFPLLPPSYAMCWSAAVRLRTQLLAESDMLHNDSIKGSIPIQLRHSYVMDLHRTLSKLSFTQQSRAAVNI